MTRLTTEPQVRQFLQETVLPAFTEISTELRVKNIDVVILHDDSGGSMRLTVPHDGLRDFVYGVRPVRKALPPFLVPATSDTQAHVFQPITFFEDGREGYNIEYLLGEEIIADILRQYERYRSLNADPALIS